MILLIALCKAISARRTSTFGSFFAKRFSALNLAETEKIIGDILGFEVKGENNVINLSITAEEYTHLAESLSENENFEGFVKINNENIIEISIFVK